MIHNRKIPIGKPLLGLAALAAMSVAAFGVAQASNSNDERVLAGYEKTGDETSCLSLSRVSKSDPIDDYAILFELRNGDVYLNELPSVCVGLARNKRFSFKTTQNRICSGDTIIVANPVGRDIGACGLGTFAALAEIEEIEENQE